MDPTGSNVGLCNVSFLFYLLGRKTSFTIPPVFLTDAIVSISAGFLCFRFKIDGILVILTMTIHPLHCELSNEWKG